MTERAKHNRLELNGVSRRKFLKSILRLFGGAVLGSLAFLSACRSTEKPISKTQPVLPETEGALPQLATSEIAPAEATPTTANQSQSANNPASPSPNEMPIVVQDNQSSISLNNYRLTVDGIVSNPLALSYQSIMAYPAITEDATLSCPGYPDQDRAWTGVPVSAILRSAGCGEQAREVTFTSLAGYSMRFSLQDIEGRGLFLAYKVDGQALPPENGFPLRLVVPDSIGGFWVKWVQSIKVA